MKAKISLPAGVAVFAFLALAGLMGLFALTAAPSAEAQEGMTIEYPENGKDPVATLSATDPEGDTINWTSTALTGADASSFSIDSDGVLTFNTPPDYEASTSGDGGGDTDTDNTYEVIVTASDGTNPDTFTVNVKVTNVAETGKVTWTVDPDGTDGLSVDDVNGGMPIMQFQDGASLTASATDGDIRGPATGKGVTTPRWQWYRSPSKTAMGTAIDGATDASYPVTTEDVGMHLRVEAFYNVGDGREESASLTSDYPVLGSRSSNEAPEFSPTMVTREVSEGKKGMTVGAPVRATDDISNALNYTLGGADEDRFEIDQKTGQIKTSVDLDRDVTTEATADLAGNCAAENSCVVTVTATDSAGAASNPVATVTITLKNVDGKPEFTETAGTALSPKAIMTPEESTALFDTDRTAGFVTTEAGVTYAATDPEDRNLTYRLMGSDGARFELSALRVLSFKEKPDYEMPADANRDNVYEVTVRASDGTMDADRMVKVTVTDANEAPEIMGKDSVNYAENRKDPVATFTATDPEGVTPITWSVPATVDAANIDGIEDVDDADNGSFTIDKDGMLKFNSPPDYEASEIDDGGGDQDNDNTYHVVVVAADAANNQGYHDVTVKVTNVAETGKVTWTVTPVGDGATDLMQFQVGALLTASATDGDIPGAAADKGVENNVSWRWYRGSALISGQTGNTYIVTTEDVNKKLRVVVAYTVGTGREESASLTSDYPVLGSRTNNEAPEFDPASITREVSEGKKGMTVGAPVRATDDISNALNYTLGGADEDRFEIDQKTGQIKTSVDLDREGEGVAIADTLGSCSNAAADNPDPECIVTVTATDSAGASSSPVATVTITLKNVDEKPKFTETAGTALSPKAIMTPEESTALSDTDRTAGFVTTEAGVTYAATDEDGLNVNLTLMGPDGAKFSLSSDGVLSFKTAPDYEMPADANKDNVYEVTVRGSDGTMYADRMVKVTVTNANEAPTILGFGLNVSGSRSVDYAENSKNAVGTYTASGPEAASAGWKLEGDDAGDFSLSSRSGMSTMLMFRTSPDFESAADADRDNVYMVTVKAMEGDNMDTHDVTVMVTDVDELDMLTGDASVSQAENVMDTLETYTISGGTMADMATWTLEGADYSHFMLEGTTGMSRMLKFKMSPDYEMPRGMAMSDANMNTYMVTVKAMAGGEMEMVEVAVTVTDMDEDGSVTIMPTMARAGVELTASLDDPDMPQTITMWDWWINDTMEGDYTMVPDELTSMYTPTADDVGKYLKARVTYTDGTFGQEQLGSDPIMVMGLSSDASLSALSLMDGDTEITLAMVADMPMKRTASVGNDVESVTVTATPNDMENAMAVIMPADADMDMDGHQVDLMVGANEITVTVTAQDGTTMMTYMVTVTRAASMDASLMSLDLWRAPDDEVGNLTTTFMTGTTEYTVMALNSDESVTVKAIPTHMGATVEVNGTAVDADGTAAVDLDVGMNTITAMVTAQDGDDDDDLHGHRHQGGQHGRHPVGPEPHGRRHRD